ncbi:MAG: phenylalanine--tRNA ligase subunit alpha [Actinomycetota bacterium]|nr:phenylalanine--tRNA ligase subunit alpha [Actinomycetota bacterium]
MSEPASSVAEEMAEFRRDAPVRVAELASLAELEDAVPSLTGKRSPLAGWKRALAGLAPDERRAVGLVLNEVANEVDALVALRRADLAATERRERVALDRLDLTEVLDGPLPGHLHLVTQVREELEDVFVGMGYEVADGPEAETEWYNFTALNMPRDHAARSNQDSFYLATGDHESHLLRTQTSPVQIRLLERGVLPLYAVAPGRVYRRDTSDARHLPVFHQIEGIAVDRGVTFGDLAGTIETFVAAIFGSGISSRLRPAYFPFTEPSAEFEITCTICRGEGCRTCGQTGWIELGGCGMVHPAVLESTGVDSETWTGFAFGFGIDRLAMMRHEVEDIRSLIENDVRFLTQF